MLTINLGIMHIGILSKKASWRFRIMTSDARYVLQLWKCMKISVCSIGHIYCLFSSFPSGWKSKCCVLIWTNMPIIASNYMGLFLFFINCLYFLVSIEICIPQDSGLIHRGQRFVIWKKFRTQKRKKPIEEYWMYLDKLDSTELRIICEIFTQECVCFFPRSCQKWKQRSAFNIWNPIL